jgi:hypothetical protein
MSLGYSSRAARVAVFGLAVVLMLATAGNALADEPARYLAFQIFTGGLGSDILRRAFPPPPNDLRRTVIELRDHIGVEGKNDRRLGFVLGLISFDNSDEDVRKLIAAGFDIALDTGVAVGFHIDDSMFWGRLKKLNTADNVEWLDWQGTLNTGRRLDWGLKPMRIMPQLCINSRDVKEAVSERATLIGNEIATGIKKLHTAHRDDLFLGVIAGSETQIGRDFDTGKYLGYCALTNAGYSANNPPADIDVARSKMITEFAGFWARSLIAAGVPEGTVYSHIAYMSSKTYGLAKRAAPYLQFINFTPPAVAFCDHCIPGFSTYPEPGHLEQWQKELNKHGDPSWASCEGTAIDPVQAALSGKGVDMEGYLGNLFNHGAVLVNVYGWGVGDDNNPFRKTAEGENALAAYRKFLARETLHEAPAIPPQGGLIDKVHKIQAEVPGWIQKNGPAQVKDNLEQLGKAIKEKHFDEAAQAADAILKTIEK